MTPRAVWLIGGGRDPELLRPCHEPFVAAARGGPIVCVALDEGDGVDDARWRGALEVAGAHDVRVVAIAAGEPPRPADFEDAGGVYVCGGLTPLYADLLTRSSWLPDGVPYAGFSAGAAAAAERAIVGGWRIDGRAACPEDAAEDLEDVAVVDGLGLVPFAVDVHAAQWGTLGRAVSAVQAGLVAEAWALDEHTALEVGGAEVARVLGAGAAYRATRDGRVDVRTAA
jgi:cyanophycinase